MDAITPDVTAISSAAVDFRLVFLARAAARQTLVEACLMSLDEAFDGLIASLTIEAVVTDVRTLGVAALKEPANIERLLRCDAAARAKIDRRIAEAIATKEIVS